MNERHQLIAYLATLVAIVVLVAIAATLAGLGRYSEAIGVSAAVTGLIGVIKSPTSRPTATNIETAGTVVGGPQAGA